jgi:Pro-kumamolisin, activation domain/Bacterial Ig-like domain (group 3)
MRATSGRVCRLSFLIFLSLSAVHFAFAQATPRVVEKIENSQRITLTGNVHPLARAAFDRGAVDNAQPMKSILMLLKRGDDQEAALQSFMEQQQDKSSPNYQVWLTPSQIGAQYGPADADVQAVAQWLQSQGFNIDKLYRGKTVIEFSGNAGQVQSAFATNIHSYQVNGQTYIANANDPQIPAALAPVVAGIVSLNNFPRQPHVRLAGQARKIIGKPGLQPLFTFPNSSGGNFYGVGPADFAKIYNSVPLLSATTPVDGTGQTIAVVGETNINVADVQAFRQIFGLSNNFSSSNIILNGEDPGITSTDEETEADLDVQWSGAVAPGATIDFVVSESTAATQGIDLSALYIIEYNLAGVLSESYGACEAAIGTGGNAFYNSLWEQAAAQGITAILSAGDAGSAACDDFNTATVATQGLAVNGFASTPYNVAMGGTDFDELNKWTTYWSATNNSTTQESALSYIPEIPWNQNCAQISLTGCGASAPQGSLNIVAGSGGSSTVYTKPKWQMGVNGMPNDSHRDLPDLSLFASAGFNGSGYIICPGAGVETGASQCTSTPGQYTFGIVGGTSASAPAFAGIMALVNQYESTHGGVARQGNADYILYPLSKKSGATCTSSATEVTTCIFNDVTKGNSDLPTGGAGLGTNSVPCQGGTLNCSITVASANGVLVEPTSSTMEAWMATAGYDLATGLGSVNVNNLATQWHTVNTVATTTTLTLSPTTGITHGTGEDVAVNVTVTPTTGTATGDVSLIATLAGPNGSTTQGLDQFTLNSSGKVVNATTNSLPGGTAYQVYAHYAGDGANAPSDSAPVVVSVAKETSQAFIVVPTFDANGNQTSGNATSVSYGSNFIIQMYVTDKNAVASASGPPAPACYQENALTCPSGTVTLKDNGTLLGTGGGGPGIYNLNSGGYTRDLTPSLTGGTYALAASYSGDNSYQASTSATATFTVTPATTQLQLSSNEINTPLGVSVPFEAIVSSQVLNGATPGGAVTFFDGTTPLQGTVFMQSGAGGMSVQINVQFTTPGTHVITAKYSGDANYAPSTSNSVTIIALIPTTMTAAFSSTNVNYGQSITVTATLSTTSKTPTITGQIAIYSNSQSIPNAATTVGTDANGNQMLSATVTFTPQTSQVVLAQYNGDANYGSSTSITNITVNIPDFSLTPPAAIVVSAGQAATGILSVTPSSNTPSSVALSVSPPANGITATISTKTVNLNGSAVPVTVTVSSLAPSSSSAPTGSVVNSRPKTAGLQIDARHAWWSLSLVTALMAFYFVGIPGRRRRIRAALFSASLCLIGVVLGCGGAGGSSGSGGNSGGGSGGGGGTPAQPTITLTASSAKIPVFTSITLTATVTSTKPLSGTVTFSAFNDSYPSEPVPVVNGIASATIKPFVNVGVYAATATYSGDANNNAATSSPINLALTGSTAVGVTGQTGGLSRSVSVPVTLQ